MAKVSSHVRVSGVSVSGTSPNESVAASPVGMNTRIDVPLPRGWRDCSGYRSTIERIPTTVVATDVSSAAGNA